MKSECRERKRLGAVVSFFLILSLILLQAGRLPAAETKTPGQENPSAAAELVKSLQEKLEAERKSIGALKEELAKAQRMRKSVEAEINAFTVQCSAYKNLLLLPTIQTSDLRKIQTNLNAALTEINTRISQLKEESKGLSEIRRQTDEQYLSGESQVAGIKTKGTTNKETEALLDQLQEFTKTLDPKRQLLEKINAIYTEYTNQLEAVQKDFTDFSGRVAEKIEQRRNRDLFERRANPLLSVTWGQVPERLGQSLSSALRIFSASFWSEQVRDVRGAADSFLVGFFLLLAITQFLLWRLRKWCLRIEESAWAGRHPWGCMVLSLFHRSLPLLGAVVLLAVYSQVRHLGTIVPLFGVVTSLLVIWLFTRWPLDLLRLWNLKREEKIPGPL